MQFILFSMKGVFIAVLLISAINGFIEQYKPNSPIIVIKELKKSTVTLSDAKVYLRKDEFSKWMEPKDFYSMSHDYSSSISDDYHRDIKVEMAVFESPSREWKALTKVGVDVYTSKNTQQGSKVNFLWTSAHENYHMFLFRVFIDPNPNVEVGIEVVIYEGRPEDPSIYSHTDSQIRNKEKRIAECINVSKDILDLQELDRIDEQSYKQLTNGIFKIILLAVFLKIGVFISSFLVINRKIQNFYVDKKIIVKN
ncbi:hypothetical protein NEPAR06_2461 [Nematocida parisii]|uniref:GOLD domain-containing protein n=1 Tax=Nematocida parisii (strain ERTm3) TaxID=935791 RepID=I3EFA7_NEMP3|nr:uncharacterized protein NEPG_02078 [Nematocida parisii ERTm1]EIJ87904.1 hypothetical protein NEQG_01976 [Nematocida parisii ERTm3]KAI5128191.1 hypothetical protein NEPAR08_1106 [Nematocida parisii]EIJ93122.1 hypothetical protein NEPG_02078 [Nematocida parisii ERTm1]KAI5128362.1 hypothetical protein NEPAR03_1271 [Nematocida parisii]KAI5141710.1 hypothetical protein NEPAR04_1182 [Nematocida parisii]|eukprot:XP_013059905.1 hypothetical protein NEPG_02078 [Nematocida parisii ERTm1]